MRIITLLMSVFFLQFTFLAAQNTERTTTDINGNVYKVVQIGTQLWFAENLKTNSYNDGTPIPHITANSEWSILKSGAYTYYENNKENFETYGNLYNWYAVNTGNLCPTGWRVPSEKDWNELSDYLGGDDIAAGKLKEGTTIHDCKVKAVGAKHCCDLEDYITLYWVLPNLDATDEFGFRALPGGVRYKGGAYLNLHSFGFWWTSTQINDNQASYRSMDYSNSRLSTYSNDKNMGFSVRCIKN